jgi:hypothetical protein
MESQQRPGMRSSFQRSLHMASLYVFMCGCNLDTRNSAKTKLLVLDSGTPASRHTHESEQLSTPFFYL